MAYSRHKTLSQGNVHKYSAITEYRKLVQVTLISSLSYVPGLLGGTAASDC